MWCHHALLTRKGGKKAENYTENGLLQLLNLPELSMAHPCTTAE